MARDGFYAVARGRRTGVFRSWAEAAAQVEGFPGNEHRKFSTLAQAEAFLRDRVALRGCSDPSARARETPAAGAAGGAACYAVVSGVHPGVFEDRDGANRGLAGISCAHSRAFPSVAEADAYLRTFGFVFDRLAEDSAGSRVWLARLAAEPPLAHAILAFCDGSLPFNGSPALGAAGGAAGAIACVFPRHAVLNVDAVDSRATTNTRAEYLAAAWALDRASALDPGQQQPLVIFTGSETLVRAMTDSVRDWERNGWKKTSGAPVKNQDVIRLLRALCGRRSVEWRHVHSDAAKGTWQWRWSKLAEDKARARASVSASASASASAASAVSAAPSACVL